MNTSIKKSVLIGFIFLFVFFNSFTFAENALPNPNPEFSEVLMEMRDEVKLAANVFFPKGKGPWPVILVRTPYLKDSRSWAAGSVRYTDNGYAYVVQDSRGRGHSGGHYEPFNDDIPDGYDTVEWIASQDWCDGNIGITGPSAMGSAGNLAAIANPPHLKAVFAIIAPNSRFLSNYINGVFKEGDTKSWLTYQNSAHMLDAYKKRVIYDVFWQRGDIKPNLKFVRIPIYNVGGWYDIFSKGNCANFQYLQNYGAMGARGNQKLLMSPTGHGQLSGDLEYPDVNSALPGDPEMRWFDYWLKGIENGIMDEPPVTYFMMASAKKGHFSKKNRYIQAANWPPAYRQVRYYLSNDRGLSKKKNTNNNGQSSYVHDPGNPVPTVGGANLFLPIGPMDQRKIPDRKDYLRFETIPLTEDVVIAGPVTVELYASTSGIDTDFIAKLVDVYPDGYEAIVLDSPIRTRYRFGRMPDDIQFMIPDKPEKLVIDLWGTAITFEKGHKIALHIASSNSPRFEVNPNTGEAPGSSKMKPIAVTNTIFHNEKYPSALVLPVIYLEKR